MVIQFIGYDWNWKEVVGLSYADPGLSMTRNAARTLNSRTDALETGIKKEARYNHGEACDTALFDKDQYLIARSR